MRGNQPLRNLNRDIKRAQRNKRKAREAAQRRQWAEWRRAAEGKDPAPFNKWYLNDEAEFRHCSHERGAMTGHKGRYYRVLNEPGAPDRIGFHHTQVSEDTWNHGLSLLKRALNERSK